VKVIKHATRLKGLEESELRPIKALYEEFYVAVHGGRPPELNISTKQDISDSQLTVPVSTPNIRPANTKTTFINGMAENAGEGPQRSTSTRSKIGGALGNILR